MGTRTILGAGLALTLATGAAAQTPPHDMPQGEGLRATSAATPDDAVGYAAVLPLDGGTGPTVGIAAEHASLPKGSFIEVTALDSGRTVAMMVVGPFARRDVVGLSPQAAEALGIVDHAPVRVRAVTPEPWEQATLRAGRSSGTRLDAPPTLLTALRKRLPPASGHAPEQKVAQKPPRAQAKPLPKPEPGPMTLKPEVAKARPAPAEYGQYQVQVVALSSADRAAALAKNVGGHVMPAGKMFRVVLGPFADARAAVQARDKAARQGYRGAQISRSD